MEEGIDSSAKAPVAKKVLWYKKPKVLLPVILIVLALAGIGVYLVKIGVISADTMWSPGQIPNNMYGMRGKVTRTIKDSGASMGPAQGGSIRLMFSYQSDPDRPTQSLDQQIATIDQGGNYTSSAFARAESYGGFISGNFIVSSTGCDDLNVDYGSVKLSRGAFTTQDFILKCGAPGTISGTIRLNGMGSSPKLKITSGSNPAEIISLQSNTPYNTIHAPGKYTIYATADGCTSSKSTSITIIGGKTTTYDATLECQKSVGTPAPTPSKTPTPGMTKTPTPTPTPTWTPGGIEHTGPL